MRWVQSEPVLKGVYLGLVLYAALQVAVPHAPDPLHTLIDFNLVTLAGLGVGIVAAAVIKLRAGYRPSWKPVSYLLLLLLESPQCIYAGILGGALVATWFTYDDSKQQLLLELLGVSGLAGLGMHQLRLVRQRLVRLGLVLLVAAAAVYGTIHYFDVVQQTQNRSLVGQPFLFALQLLISLPFFYTLVFSGYEEESESDMGVLCALIGVGTGLLIEHWPDFRMQLRSVLFLGPGLIYLWYVMRVLPRLRVIKHAFRGVAHLRARRHRNALLAFRRALAHDPNNLVARKGYWEVHTQLDLDRLPGDHELLALVDFDLCLERAGAFLLAGRPSAERLVEARRLLQLILARGPALRPVVDYWEAVALTHEGRLDEAAAMLGRLLDPSIYGAGDPQRRGVLLPAWSLALRLHPGLAERLGKAQLAIPGRRLEAIAAVERHLANEPQDADVLEFKRELYADLTEEEYRAGVPADRDRPLADFDYRYVQKLGVELVAGEHWPRGIEYLHIAAHGLPSLGPSLFVQIARAQQRNGDEGGALRNFELARQAGRDIGPKNLGDAEARAYFATVKYLGALALQRGDLPEALENYRLAAASPVADGESYRNLAEVYERQGEVMAALRANETALIYLPKDKDLQERKQRYYFSLSPGELRDKLDQVRAGFDFEYCLARARTLLDGAQYTDLEWLEVAEHLTALALVGDPSGFRGRVLQARVLLRRGEREQAVAVLEQIRAQKPASFANGDEENAWYQGQQVLGDLYVEGGLSDKAIPCYLDYRHSHQSGARTVFKLGQCYEQLGDTARAMKCYKLVTGYDGNPLVYEARAALSRMQTPSSSGG